jgi:pyruvate dehydrogenase kinase 2/3/4
VYQWNDGKILLIATPLFFTLIHSPRYYADTDNIAWPPQVQDYNKRFTKVLQAIKTRHDPTVTTVAQGVLEWKRSHNAQHIGLDIQSWLDRFYMSRIGIRFLIGQREVLFFQNSYFVFIKRISF